MSSSKGPAGQAHRVVSDSCRWVEGGGIASKSALDIELQYQTLGQYVVGGIGPFLRRKAYADGQKGAS